MLLYIWKVSELLYFSFYSKFSCSSCFSLPKDYYIIGLIFFGEVDTEKWPKTTEDLRTKPDETKDLCYSCNVAAWKSCNKCCKVLCEDCFKKFHSFEIFSDHHLVNSSKSLENFLRLFYEEHFCKRHESVKKVFCLTCKKTVCLDCIRCCRVHNFESVEVQVRNRRFQYELLIIICTYRIKLNYRKYKTSKNS